jgi:hypothetical protein
MDSGFVFIVRGRDSLDFLADSRMQDTDWSQSVIVSQLVWLQSVA